MNNKYPTSRIPRPRSLRSGPSRNKNKFPKPTEYDKRRLPNSSPKRIIERQTLNTNIRWRANHYEDRDILWGETRNDEYHASRLYPNYRQFSKTSTGPTMTDSKGLEYQIADGMDRLLDEEKGLVTAGPPSLVEPKISSQQSTSSKNNRGKRKQISFWDDNLGMYVQSKERMKAPMNRVNKGSQLLYFRIPIKLRKRTPNVQFPRVGQQIRLFHYPSEGTVTGTIVRVDGDQYERFSSTGSILVKDLTFIF